VTGWHGRSWTEHIERRDLHYLGVLGTRKRVVSQLPIIVTPASNDPKHVEHANFVRAWVERGTLRRGLFDMMDALGKGYSVHETDWHCASGNFYPEKFTFRPARWFEVSYQDGETILIREEAGKAAASSVPDGIPQTGFADMVPYKFVVHRHPSWSGLTIQSGLTRACVWAINVQAVHKPRLAAVCAELWAADADCVKQWFVTHAHCDRPGYWQIHFGEVDSGLSVSIRREPRA
jgi:phage gp29-like protein